MFDADYNRVKAQLDSAYNRAMIKADNTSNNYNRTKAYDAAERAYSLGLAKLDKQMGV